MSFSKLNLVAAIAAFAAQLADGGTAIAPADIGRRVESGGQYRRGEISARQQRKPIKASRRGNVA